MRHGGREYASKSSAVFSQKFTVSVTANLPSKNIICPSSVLTFFLLIFQSVHLVFSLVLRSSFKEALTILQVRLFVGFRHLEGTVGV